jgi:hypothetical protein
MEQVKNQLPADFPSWLSLIGWCIKEGMDMESQDLALIMRRSQQEDYAIEFSISLEYAKARAMEEAIYFFSEKRTKLKAEDLYAWLYGADPTLRLASPENFEDFKSFVEDLVSFLKAVNGKNGSA